ncbi:unnamed protein product, partial [Choristocarpus tenellus]
KSYGCKLVSKYTNEVTHVVCAVEQGTKVAKVRSAKYLRAVAAGKWAVHPGWLQACLTRHSIVDEAGFELTGDLKSCVQDAPRRSRLGHADEV